MQDATNLVTPSWVAERDKEAKACKTWDKAKLKKWQDDYLKTSLLCAKIVLENGQETVQKLDALKVQMKGALEIAEKLVQQKRKANSPLSDAESDYIEKAQSVIGNGDKAFKALVAQYTAKVPDAQNGAFRGSFWAYSMESGAVTEAMKAAIMAGRKRGIDLSNEFGKTSPLVAQFAEYPKRFAILQTELKNLQKLASGKSAEWAADITQQIKALEAGNVQWTDDLDAQIAMTANKLKSVFDNIGKLDSGSSKSFGASLVKNAKLMMSNKAKEKDEKKLKAAETARSSAENQLITVPGKLKLLKGGLKTRKKERESLLASLDKVSDEMAAPFRKMLDVVGKSLNEREVQIDDLDQQMSEALAVLRK